MKSIRYSIREKVWLWPGDNPWHFVTIKKGDAREIAKHYIWPRRGFGAIPVEVTIGKTTWKTSIFPEKEGNYLLPLKKEVRTSEVIKVRDEIKISIEVIT
ncbi:DUF1905 domain-containing protein [Candidatus Amesbacteria bacterium]|nr:DUF1905 domain-containing protein [Candidatus Amesbacteria bacterium]